MKSFRKLSDGLAAHFIARARRIHRASMYVKGILVLGGSLVAGIAQFTTSSGSLEVWGIVGIAASTLVAIGGFFLLLSDGDSSMELANAREAVEAVRERDEEATENELYLETLNEAVARSVELYSSMDRMSQVIQNVVGLKKSPSEIGVCQLLMSVVGKSLAAASGFMLNEHWTIVVYKAEFDTSANRYVLCCVADHRSTKCEIENARKWPDGVGIAGAAFASGVETIVPDLRADGVGNRFDASNLMRSDDTIKYGSLFAVPVKLTTDANTRPWGVVVVSSQHANHFHATGPSEVRTIEAARALARMLSLGITVVQQCGSSTPPSGEPTPSKTVK